jgi:hypothetical protein
VQAGVGAAGLQGHDEREHSGDAGIELARDLLTQVAGLVQSAPGQGCLVSEASSVVIACTAMSLGEAASWFARCSAR